MAPHNMVHYEAKAPLKVGSFFIMKYQVSIPVTVAHKNLESQYLCILWHTGDC